MRFMFDGNDILEVKEIDEIDASPCWKNGSAGRENNPDSFIVTIYKSGWNAVQREDRELYEIWGEYLLDGTEKTYLKAVENYNKVCMKLLEKGYCKASDFENFDWD